MDPVYLLYTAGGSGSARTDHEGQTLIFKCCLVDLQILFYCDIYFQFQKLKASLSVFWPLGGRKTPKQAHSTTVLTSADSIFTPPADSRWITVVSSWWMYVQYSLSFSLSFGLHPLSSAARCSTSLPATCSFLVLLDFIWGSWLLILRGFRAVSDPFHISVILPYFNIKNIA